MCIAPFQRGYYYFNAQRKKLQEAHRREERRISYTKTGKGAEEIRIGVTVMTTPLPEKER